MTPPALAIVKPFNGWVPPTAPVNVTIPAPATKFRFLVLFASPSSVLLSVMAPPPVVNVEPAVVSRMTATGKMRELADVVILAPRKIVPDEEKLTAFETRSPRIKISPPVKDKEANSPLAAIPIVERVIAPLPAFNVTVRKSLVTASRGESVIAPPPELIVRLVPEESEIADVENEIGVLELVKVVNAPAVKRTAGVV